MEEKLEKKRAARKQNLEEWASKRKELGSSMARLGKSYEWLGLLGEEFVEAEDVREITDSLANIYTDQIAVELAVERFTVIVDHFQYQPHVVDPHIEPMLLRLLDIARNTDNDPQLSHLAFKCLYLITKMRGPKVVVRFLPHEVVDLEPTLALLEKQDVDDHEHWETRYMLLLWLSIICMIPFDMARLDSNIRDETGDIVKEPVMMRLYNIAKGYLNKTDTSRDAAATMLSKFLTRHDVKQKLLPEFMDWALVEIGESEKETMTGIIAMSGVLSTLSLLFKQGKREDIVQYAPIVLERLAANKLFEIPNSQMRKLAIKLTQRLGLTFLKTRVASWRYQRGSRSLAKNMESVGKDVDEKQTKDVEMEEEEEEYDIPEEMEEVIERLLVGLKDPDTIVRWSAAKGIGRVTGRLPQELADQVVGSVLELFSIQETDSAWHGGCLALAELGRRGLLLPDRLPEVVPVVLKALAYDEKKGSCSVGMHVRDAACYVSWAFARAYDPDVIKMYVNQIASALIITTVFDREVTCRRAASAAFQENVGRLGTFPHGIDIVTTADYFAVGNRTNTYLSTSVYISQFDEYTIALIDHLVKVKISHWDGMIRDLASQSLHNLTCKAPEYMAKTILPFLVPLTTGIDLNTRHGALLAAAEITHALYLLAEQNGQTIVDVVDEATIAGMREITFKMDEGKMFKGLSGNVLRPAACKLIEKLSMSKLPYHGDPVIEHWQYIIDENIIFLQRTHLDIQSYAIAALKAFGNEYYRQPDGTPIPGIQDKLVDNYVKELQSTNIMARMGSALALGCLPQFMITGKLDQIFKGLISASVLGKDEARFAEGARDAVKSITCASLTVGLVSDGNPKQVVCRDNINMLYTALLRAMKDYSTDARGDVGAWVREASMESMRDLTSLIVKTDPSLLSPEICERMMQCLLQQGSEKIDRTRAYAGQAFLTLLYHDPPVPHIPERDQLLIIFPKSDLLELNLSAPSESFPKMTQLLSLPAYGYHVLLGLTVSVGGLTESLVKHSVQSLQAYLKDHSSPEELEIFTATLLKIYVEFYRVDRVCVPLMKMTDMLLSSGSLEFYVEHPENPFPDTLLAHLKKELLKCADPQKIITSVDVFCGLIQFPGGTRRKSLSQLLMFMCHKYPKVRMTTANKLYETLLVNDDVCEEETYDDVLSLLSDTKWDEPLTKVRPLRNQLCDMMNIPKPIPKKKENNATTRGGGGQVPMEQGS